MKRFKSTVLLVCMLTLLLGTADYANAGNEYWIEIGDSNNIGYWIKIEGSNDIPYYDNCYKAKTIGDEEYLPFDTTLLP